MGQGQTNSHTQACVLKALSSRLAIGVFLGALPALGAGFENDPTRKILNFQVQLSICGALYVKQYVLHQGIEMEKTDFPTSGTQAAVCDRALTLGQAVCWCVPWTLFLKTGGRMVVTMVWVGSGSPGWVSGLPTATPSGCGDQPSQCPALPLPHAHPAAG